MTGKDIKFVNLDVAEEYDRLVQLFKDEQPDAVVHFAEQRAAPYSMKAPRQRDIPSTTMCLDPTTFVVL